MSTTNPATALLELARESTETSDPQRLRWIARSIRFSVVLHWYRLCAEHRTVYARLSEDLSHLADLIDQHGVCS